MIYKESIVVLILPFYKYVCVFVCECVCLNVCEYTYVGICMFLHMCTFMVCVSGIPSEHFSHLAFMKVAGS